ncbi:MAG: nickel-responsive transcriptional regulator NikR [Methanomassiliicoccales archaeon]|nr:nickel-responsive transcriptional regulator NikR [Methanomassiliicoccales archaeon]
MENVTRIGVSLEPELLKSFDLLVAQKGYATRSEAIRDLIRNALVQESVEHAESHAVGTITLVYEHSKGGVKDNMMDVQHRHHGVISSSIHVHLDEEKCLEVLIVHGTVESIQELAKDLMNVKGLTHGQPVMIAGELSEHHGH